MKKKIQKIFLWGLIGLTSTMLVGETSLIALNQSSSNDITNLRRNPSVAPSQVKLTSTSNESQDLAAYLTFASDGKGGYTVEGFSDKSVPTDLDELVIPSTYNQKPVTSIKKYAFAHKAHPTFHIEAGKNAEAIAQIKKVTIPSSVTTIGDGAFYDGYIKDLYLSEGLTTIKPYAFFYCNRLEKILLPSTVSKVEKGAFMQCLAATVVRIPKNLSSFSENCFAGCESIPRLVLSNPNASYEIHSGAFGWWNKVFKEVTIIGEKVNMFNEAGFYADTQDDLKLWINNSQGVKDGLLYNETTNRHGFTQFNVLDQHGDLYTRKVNSNITELVGLSPIDAKKDTIVLPENIVKIADFAFDSCPDSIKRIEIKNTSPNLDIGDYGLYGLAKKIRFVIHDSNTKAILMNHSISETQIDFASPLSTNSVVTIVVISLALGLIFLGAGIIIPMRRQHKIAMLNSKLTNRRIDKLAMGNAMAFKKVIEATDAINRQMKQLSKSQSLEPPRVKQPVNSTPSYPSNNNRFPPRRPT